MSQAGDPASTASWPHTPLSRPTPIPNPRRAWSDDDWARIRRGHVPTSGDPNWFAFVEGDRLSLHDSATGAGVYQVRFRRELSGWRIVATEVESDPSVHQRASDAEESAAVQSLIERLLLSP